MAEGVDLKGDSSRFQIICKIPYPYLGDKLVWIYGLHTVPVVEAARSGVLS